MPTSIIVAIAAETIGGFVAGSALAYSAISSVSWLTYSMISAGSSFIAGALLRGALAGGADQAQTSSPSFTSTAQARTHVLRSSVANRQIIYGRAMVSGPLIFAASSANNNTLHLVIALAGHECDAVEQVYFNDEAVGTLDGAGNVTTGTYSGYARIIAHLGAPGQTADADLIAAGVGWTADHRLLGTTYIVVRLAWNRDVYARGIPNIKAVVRGKKLTDPRIGQTVWSQNWALAVRDYLASADGLRCTAAEIDDTAINAAANISDEAVALAAGGTEPRYTCNTVIDTGSTPKNIMQSLLSGGGGTLTWPAGIYTLHAGVYEAPAVTLDADDLRGPVRIRARVARQDLYNAVKGTFVDPAQNWQPVDFPALKNATYAAQDGATIWHDLAFPVTTSSATAQRLARIMLEKSRQGITVEFPAKLGAVQVAVWDTVRVTLDHLGWSAKEFKVTSWRFSETGGVDLTLQEEAAACYAWSAEETIADPALDTNLPDPFTVAAPGVPEVAESLYQTTGSAGVKSRATITWSAVPDAFVVSYQAQIKAHAAADWQTLPLTNDLSIVLDDMAPGIYDFRVKALNALGVSSAWSGTANKELLGLTAPPADVTGFSVTKSAGFALASWTLHADLDVRIGGRIVIRHTPELISPVWSDSYIVEEFTGDTIAGLVPLITGTYMAKAVDSSANYSYNTAIFLATEGMVSGWSTVGTSTQSPTFPGAKTNVEVDSLVGLRLSSLTLFDDLPGTIDEWQMIDWGGETSPTGSYAFDAVMDLGTVATRRFEADITTAAWDTGDWIDARTDNIDDWGYLDANEVNDCDLTLYAATTDDDPSGSPAWSAWAGFFVADLTCRAAKFRLDFASGNPKHNIAVSNLVVHAKALI